jgi:hypothetical protein
MHIFIHRCSEINVIIDYLTSIRRPSRETRGERNGAVKITVMQSECEAHYSPAV